MTASEVADAEQLARRFHEVYEHLAPSFGYATRPDSAVPWGEVPEQNRRLMIAVAAEILAAPFADRTVPPLHVLDRDAALASAEQYGEQLEAVGEELDRWKREVRLVGKNREHAERLEDILEGERS